MTAFPGAGLAAGLDAIGGSLAGPLARLIHVVRDFAVAFGLPDCGRAAPFGYFAA